MKHLASRIGLSLLVLALAFASGATPVRATQVRADATTEILNSVHVPIIFSELVACAADGTGEIVDFSGYFHDIWIYTESSGGPVHFKLTAFAQGVKGIGRVTGDSYVYSGGFSESGVLSVGETFTVTYNSRIIGQGAGNNFIAQNIAHYTFNANGELVVDFEFSDASCK